MSIRTDRTREDLLRDAPKYSSTCPKCGETRLMWKHHWDSGEERLWQPFHFHECKNVDNAAD